MAYQIFKIDQADIMNEKIKSSQSITGNSAPLDFCVVDIADNILPGEEFEITLSSNIKKMIVENQLYMLKDTAHDNEKPFSWFTSFFVQNIKVLGDRVHYSVVKAGKSFLTAFKDGTETKMIWEDTDTPIRKDGDFYLDKLALISGFASTHATGKVTPMYIGFLKEDEEDLNNPDSYEWTDYLGLHASTDLRPHAYAYSADGKRYFSTEWQHDNLIAESDFKAATPTKLPAGFSLLSSYKMTVQKNYNHVFPGANPKLNVFEIESNGSQAQKVGALYDLKRTFKKGEVVSFSYYVDSALRLGKYVPFSMVNSIAFMIGGKRQSITGASVAVKEGAQGVLVTNTVTVPADATEVRIYAHTTVNDNVLKSLKMRLYGFKIEIGNFTLWCGNATENKEAQAQAFKIYSDGDAVLRIRGNNIVRSRTIEIRSNETYTVEVMVRAEDIAKQTASATALGILYDNNPSDTAWVTGGFFTYFRNNVNNNHETLKPEGHNTVFTYTGDDIKNSNEWAKLQFKITAPSQHPNIGNKLYLQIALYNQTTGTSMDYKDAKLYIGDEGGTRKALLL